MTLGTGRAPEDKWVSAGGLRLHYRDWGGSGRPLVLLHGLASTCHIWDLVAPILARRFSVVALDQRGHGESGKPDTGYDFATVCADLHAFLQQVGVERPVIVGHSWGGDVALEYSVAYPGVPAGLAFVDGGTIDISSRPDMTVERAKVEMAPPVWTGVRVEDFVSRVRSMRFGGEANPEVERIILANFEVLEDQTIQARLSRENHMRIIESFFSHHPRELYPRVRCPVLLMPARNEQDGSDVERRRRKEEVVASAGALLPLSSTVWLENSIHDVPLQRSALVADVLTSHIEDGFFEQVASDASTHQAGSQ